MDYSFNLSDLCSIIKVKRKSSILQNGDTNLCNKKDIKNFI